MAQGSADADEIRLSKDRRRLTLSRAGRQTVVGAEALREACRCAACVRARVDEAPPLASAGLTITGIDAMGTGAANIQFSDGHGRGVFPFAYLWQLAELSCSKDAA